MDPVDTLIKDAKSIVNEIANAALASQQIGNIIDINIIQAREHSIEQLIRIKKFLLEAVDVVETKTSQARTLQNADMKKIDQFMNNFKANNSWKNKLMVGMGNQKPQDAAKSGSADNSAPPPQAPSPQKSTADGSTLTPASLTQTTPSTTPPISTLSSTPAVPSADPQPQTQNRKNDQQTLDAPPGITRNLSPQQKIFITDNIYLNAVNINHINEIKTPGVLYYISAMDHFAIKINSYVFHGNIGNIFHSRRDPERIKTCKFGANCNKLDTCSYYHDPILYPGRKDIRNYAANSWTYVEPTALNRDPNRVRRFGSREHLVIDIENISDEEVERFGDQMFHDMLCMMVLYTCRRANSMNYGM